MLEKQRMHFSFGYKSNNQKSFGKRIAWNNIFKNTFIAKSMMDFWECFFKPEWQKCWLTTKAKGKQVDDNPEHTRPTSTTQYWK